MRRMIALFAFILLSAAGALCIEKATVEVRGDYWGMNIVDPPQQTQTAGRFAWRARPVIKPPHWSPTDNTCYTMHTLVAEKKPQSDETEIVKQHTCTPASQFQMKHADQQAK